ncbi:hypothetical protein F0562_019418 [Nyssa sinensis]|uniref:Small ribosomal subunit protein uS15 N-terminal domain-containing protein n=1 Tax=Nyssa sinensis TaxID=561372 RepID=A0A5J4ZE48_9ASTE|nr:hypothetical protein F0562_019418 [Nyssa sinensis]
MVGAMATLVDRVGLAIVCTLRAPFTRVSVKINVSYLDAAYAGIFLSSLSIKDAGSTPSFNTYNPKQLKMADFDQSKSFFRRTLLSRLKISAPDIEENICKFAKKGMTSPQIGVALRDSHVRGSAVARGISPNLALFFRGEDKLPAFLARHNILGFVVNPCTTILVFIVTGLLCIRIKENSLAQAIVTTVNIGAMIFVIIAGGYLVPYYALDPDTLIPSAFASYGTKWTAYIITPGAVTALCETLLGSVLPKKIMS